MALNKQSILEEAEDILANNQTISDTLSTLGETTQNGAAYTVKIETENTLSPSSITEQCDRVVSRLTDQGFTVYSPGGSRYKDCILVDIRAT